MSQTDASIGTINLGDIVVASCELGNAVASDDTRAMDLAAHHLGRILARGRNRKLVHALNAMAREFPVTTKRAVRRAPRKAEGRRITAPRSMKRAA
jgi:hypothetical protein